ncbi:MAG: NifU family protein [Candidatus Helarchaeota archaeon]
MAIAQEKVKEAIDKIRPSLQADGGNIELLGIEGNKVKVRLLGACSGCAMSQYTLKMGVERFLREQVSKDIEVITG